MVVVLNPPGIVWALENPLGPTGLRIEFLADRVKEKAFRNASGDVIDYRTERLRKGIQRSVDVGAEGLEAVVGTDALNPRDDFNYPAFLDQDGIHNWLTGALRDVFAGG